jgi:hypothetical protein
VRRRRLEGFRNGIHYFASHYGRTPVRDKSGLSRTRDRF